MGELSLLVEQLIDQWGAYKESLDLENKHREEEVFNEHKEQLQQYEERKKEWEQLEQEHDELYWRDLREYEALPRYKRIKAKLPEKINLRTPYNVLFHPALCSPLLVYPTWTGFLDWLSVQRKQYVVENDEERKGAHHDATGSC